MEIDVKDNKIIIPKKNKTYFIEIGVLCYLYVKYNNEDITYYIRNFENIIQVLEYLKTIK